MEPAVLLQILAAVGGLAGIGSIIRVAFERRKNNAETTNIIQGVNDKIIQNLTAENHRLQTLLDDYEADMQKIRNQLKDLSDRVAVYDLEMGDLRVLMMGHVNWSKRAFEALDKANKELTEHGVTSQFNIEPPPDAASLIARFGYIESRARE